jgi:hypothetical protein
MKWTLLSRCCWRIPPPEQQASCRGQSHKRRRSSAGTREVSEIAHTIAAQTIRVTEPDREAKRVKAAERQVKLVGRLYTQLQAVTQVEQR